MAYQVAGGGIMCMETEPNLEEWVSRGWKLPTILAWQRYGFTPTTAKKWMMEGFSPSEAARWSVVKNPILARKWRYSGYTPIVAQARIELFGQLEPPEWTETVDIFSVQNQ